MTVVGSAEELQAAVVAGAPHIELQAHIDLTSTALLRIDSLPVDLHLGQVPTTVRSITVCHLTEHPAHRPVQA